MVDTCTVTWTARDFEFATVGGAQLAFVPREGQALAGVAGVVYVPATAEAVSDSNGVGSIALVPGYYVLTITTPDGVATAGVAVPNLASAEIGACIDRILELPGQNVFQALVDAAEAAAAASNVSADDAAASAAASAGDAAVAGAGAATATAQAIAAADSALSAAGSASDAETARIVSESARDAAVVAKSAAELALDGAVAARVGSEAAQSVAQDAQTSAAAARDVAQVAASAAGASAAAAASDAAAAGVSAATATTQATSASASAASAATSASAATGAKTAAEAAQVGAQAARSGAETAQIGAQTARSGAETAQTGAQTARTGAEAAQTSAQTARTGAEAARDVAQAQASLSAGYAASAASVVQQDLSGVTAQALHRSPNAITAMFIYDTSKDSDGGAWTERCQHTSWWNEAINGKWLGSQATEAAARAVSGATTGDYFQRTSDGRFFSLNAGSGITEVYRGNKRDFPRLAGIVAEATSVIIYDLTEPGRPMWMRFFASINYTTFLNWASNTGTMTGIAGANAKVMLLSLGGSLLLDFVKDDALCVSNGAGRYLPKRQIADRQSSGSYVASGGDGIQMNVTVNAVAMTVLPDAPVDPVTGLRVPTIAVATGGGVSVIKHNGTVVNSTAGAFDQVTISPAVLTASRGYSNADQFIAFNPGSLPSSFTFVTSFNNQFDASGSTSRMVARGRASFLKATTSRVAMRVLNDSMGSFGRHLSALVASTFNTGWMTGDVRRCFLSDVVAGSVVGPVTVADRSYKAAAATTTGTLTKAELASGTSLVAYSGWSAANYLREPYSADLDFGAGEWTGSAWVNVPVSLPTSSFPTTGANLVTNGSFDTDISGWSPVAGSTLSAISGKLRVDIGALDQGASCVVAVPSAGLWKLRLTINRQYTASGLAIFFNNWQFYNNASFPSGESVVEVLMDTPSAVNATLLVRTGQTSGSYSGFFTLDDVSVVQISGPAAIAARAAASGPRIVLGVTSQGRLTAEAFDGTTTRTVTTTASYNTAQWLKARVSYTTDGTLAILVNGREVAATRGTPLATLNNASAVLTIGNSYDLAAPFPGSIALLKLGATVPTAEQAMFMFEQEKQLFRAGALSVLPDAGALVDMAYDAATDRWVALSPANESYWTGLVRNSVTAVPAGSYSRVAAGSGLELTARTTTNPGVDVTIPAYGLREELVNRAEAAARLSRELAVFDFVGGFTANTTNGSTAITSVAGLTYPTSYIGARVSGAGIPANTTITAVSGTTIYLSATATATATGVSVSFLDFALPVGLEAKAVLSAGALRQEGSTKDFTRLFDGFREAIRFAVAPGATAWVQIQAARAAQ